MSDLKDFYVDEIGHEYSRIENSLWYLSELCLRGAHEIDKHLLGRNHDFSHVQELAGILGKYHLKDSDTILTAPPFPYLSLWKVMRKNSDKTIRWISELALEIRLLRSELEEIPKNSKRLEELRSVLCDFSTEFSNEEHEKNYPNYLVA